MSEVKATEGESADGILGDESFDAENLEIHGHFQAFIRTNLQGKKVYEYRKFRCRSDVDKIIIYATAPQQQVVAEAEIADIIEDDVLSVWRQTKNYSGITYAFFRKYYKGKKKAVAYHLKNIVIYDKTFTLEDMGVQYLDDRTVYFAWHHLFFTKELSYIISEMKKVMKQTRLLNFLTEHGERLR